MPGKASVDLIHLLALDQGISVSCPVQSPSVPLSSELQLDIQSIGHDMTRLTILGSVFLLNVFSAVVADQHAFDSTAKCALGCARAVPTAEDQSLSCTNVTLQMEIEACVLSSCTVKEALTVTNATAAVCQWPYSDESHLCQDVAIVLFTGATAAVGARLLSRLPRFNGIIGIDDYVMIFTWVQTKKSSEKDSTSWLIILPGLLIPFTVLWGVLSNIGLWRDIWTLPFEDITLYQIYTQILICHYIFLIWLTKISILLLYLRLFPEPRLRKVFKFAALLCCMAGIAFLLGSILICQPIDYAWTFWHGEHTGKCSSILLSAQGWPILAVNVFADLVILLLPLPTIWKLHLALEKKLGIMTMFGVGVFLTTINVYRATTFPRLSKRHNITWDFTPAGVWSTIEVYVGVICVCMPGIQASISKILPGRRWGKEARTSRHYPSFGEIGASGTIGSSSSAKKQMYSAVDTNNGHRVDQSIGDN